MAEKAFKLDYAKYYDFFNQGKDYVHETAFLKKTFDMYSKKPVMNVLNLGCGTGMHEIELVKHGYHVHGLDLSPEMVAIAQSRNIPNTSFEVGDMSHFKVPKQFDACTVMFAAFGYLTKNQQIESSLKTIHDHLNPEGLAIIEVWNGPGVLTIKPSSRIKEFTRDGIDVHRQSFPTLHAFDQNVEILFKVRLSQNGAVLDQYEELHTMRFFFPQEMIYYFNKAGFDVLEICKTFELGTTVDENEWNMVVIAKKR